MMLLFFPLALHNTSSLLHDQSNGYFHPSSAPRSLFLRLDLLIFQRVLLVIRKLNLAGDWRREKWIKTWLKLALSCSEGDPWNCGKVTPRDHGLALEQQTEQETSRPLCSAQFVPRVCQGIAEVMTRSHVDSIKIIATAGFREMQRNEGNVFLCWNNQYVLDKQNLGAW